MTDVNTPRLYFLADSDCGLKSHVTPFPKPWKMTGTSSTQIRAQNTLVTGRVQAWAKREKSSADIMEVWKEAGAWTCLSLFVISFIGASQRSHDSFVRFNCQGYSTSVKRLIFIRIAESNFRDYSLKCLRGRIRYKLSLTIIVWIWQRLSNIFCLLSKTAQKPLSVQVKELLK
ncbi:hypothetical protein ARMGADRAFT_1037317 [Armillaria gallica]|uniref:Uncharacterized protein n=1 Tax=Armillaria gallica TaxID=47427 RepID=A0A2H3CRZ3_ARMGA|nr:hypothetical protein ARMGADRAFT_1037317 [Armillaria gallica]